VDPVHPDVDVVVQRSRFMKASCSADQLAESRVITGAERPAEDPKN